MIRQRTIKGTVSIRGIGLQTGKPVTTTLKSAPADSGINFIRTDLAGKPALNLRSLDLKGPGLFGFARRTTIGKGRVRIQTTEHLMAALSGFGINNIVIEADNEELPGLDGSALDFIELIKRAGIIEQDAPRKIFDVKERLSVRRGDSGIDIIPAGSFKISYTLSYPNPALGTQVLSLEIDEKSFEKEIAPARTFCLEEEARKLLRLGLGKGASYENTLVMGKDGPVKNRLRFSDEPVRHKILDLIGDLYLLGMPVKGHIIAVKSGHRLNMELVMKIKMIQGEKNG